MNELTITQPDDWHLHLRDSPYLEAVVKDSARQFARAIIMPNLTPPVRSCEDAEAYRQRILQALPAESKFQPLMTLYLTDNTSVTDIEEASRSEHIFGAKLYPAGATTNSDAGVTDLAKLDAVFDAMQEHGLVLQVHGEATATDIDVFDREKVFIDRSLVAIRERFPELRIVFEHITTREAVEFVRANPTNLGATITAHHLLMSRNALFEGGLRPHHYCLPILKRELHREALVEAATGGEPNFFLGTDSAPHPRDAKESACGCAGMYTAHAAIELYAEVFEDAGCLDRLEGFASLHGPQFYGLEPSDQTLTLRREPWTVPDVYPFGDGAVVPFRAGGSVRWRVAA